MKTTLRIATIGVAAFSLGGCSLLGSSSSDAPEKDVAAKRPKSAATAKAAQPQHVIASHQASLQNDTARVDLTGLKQAGSTVTVEFTVTSLTANNSLGIQIGHEFTAVDDKTASGTASGVTLIDGVNKKKHLVATDSQGDCVCSQNLSAVFVKKGQTVSFTATFGAPPANVKTVDVQIPRVPVFHDVPIA